MDDDYLSETRASLGWQTFEETFGEQADRARDLAGEHRAHRSGELISPALADLVRRQLPTALARLDERQRGGGNLEKLLELKAELAAEGRLEHALAVEWALVQLVQLPEAPVDAEVQTVCTLCPVPAGRQPHAATARRRAGKWSVRCPAGAGTTALSRAAIENLERLAAELAHA